MKAGAGSLELAQARRERFGVYNNIYGVYDEEGTLEKSKRVAVAAFAACTE